METALLIVVIGVLVAVVVTMIVKKAKKKPQPSPTPVPSPRPPRYIGFLNNVETVIRNNLSEDELKSFFESVKGQYDMYKTDPGFIRDFNALLAKYNVTNPY